MSIELVDRQLEIMRDIQTMFNNASVPAVCKDVLGWSDDKISERVEKGILMPLGVAIQMTERTKKAALRELTGLEKTTFESALKKRLNDPDAFLNKLHHVLDNISILREGSVIDNIGYIQNRVEQKLSKLQPDFHADDIRDALGDSRRELEEIARDESLDLHKNQRKIEKKHKRKEKHTEQSIDALENLQVNLTKIMDKIEREGEFLNHCPLDRELRTLRVELKDSSRGHAQ